MRYRPKTAGGEKEEGDGPGSDKAVSDEEGATGDRRGRADRKSGKKDDEKNIVYKNPVDFVETKTFKSKYEEFKLGDWRKGSGKTFVTLETAIPDMPKNPTKEPDEKTFSAKLKEIESKLKDQANFLEEKKEQFDTTLKAKILQQKAGDGQVVPASKEIGDAVKELKQLHGERKEI